MELTKAYLSLTPQSFLWLLMDRFEMFRYPAIRLAQRALEYRDIFGIRTRDLPFFTLLPFTLFSRKMFLQKG